MEIANIQYEYLFTSIIDIQLDYMRKINSGNSLGSSICQNTRSTRKEVDYYELLSQISILQDFYASFEVRAMV